jgi:hypothetical protein
MNWRIASLLIVVAFRLYSEENFAAIKEFGVDKGPPIDSGFFFFKGKYEKPPYVIERRGLDILINDRLVSPGSEWPLFDPAVKEDPGDPPAGSSPLDDAPKGTDPRQGYWPRKTRYLEQKFGNEKAWAMMLELYRKCPRIREASEGKNPGQIQIVDDNGRKVRLLLESFEPAVSREELLDQRNSAMKSYASRLTANDLLDVDHGYELIVPAPHSFKALEILNSTPDYLKKLDALKNAGLIPNPNEHDLLLIREFTPDPAIAERLGRLKEPKDPPPVPRKVPESPKGEESGLEKISEPPASASPRSLGSLPAGMRSWTPWLACGLVMLAAILWLIRRTMTK